jgi:hypothetical protein
MTSNLESLEFVHILENLDIVLSAHCDTRIMYCLQWTRFCSQRQSPHYVSWYHTNYKQLQCYCFLSINHTDTNTQALPFQHQCSTKERQSPTATVDPPPHEFSSEYLHCGDSVGKSSGFHCPAILQYSKRERCVHIQAGSVLCDHQNPNRYCTAFSSTI